MTTTVGTPTHARDPSLRPVGVTLIVLAGLLLGNTLAGPLVTGVIDYPISDSMLNQLLGLEIVTVTLVVPVTAVAGLLAMRGVALAPLLAIGPTAYAAYMFAQWRIERCQSWPRTWGFARPTQVQMES